MNVTLLYLHLYSFSDHSPFLSLSPSLSHSSSSSLTFQNLKLSNFFKSFFQANNFANIKAQKSTFCHFLDTSLKFTSLDLYNIQSYEDHTHSYGALNPIVYVIECRFQNCGSTSSNGGGIFFDQKVTNIIISQNIFIKCKTNKCGGAFYGSVKESLITRNYFNECSAVDNGHAFTIHHILNEHHSVITDNMLVDCSSSKKIFGMAAINIVMGTSKMRMMNMTSCHAAQMSSCISFIIQKETSLSFSNLANSSGSTLIKSFNVKLSSYFGFCNFVSNVNSKCLFQFESDNIFISCLFKNNTFPIIIAISPSRRETVMTMTMVDCVTDFDVKSLQDNNSVNFDVTISNVYTTADPQTIDLRFGVENEGIPRIEEEGENDRYMDNIVPERHHKVYEERFRIPHEVPQKRGSEEQTVKKKSKQNIVKSINPIEPEKRTVKNTPFPTKTPVFVLKEEEEVEIVNEKNENVNKKNIHIKGEENEESSKRKTQTEKKVYAENKRKKVTIAAPLIDIEKRTKKPLPTPTKRVFETRKHKNIANKQGVSKIDDEIGSYSSPTLAFTASASFTSSQTAKRTNSFTSSWAFTASMQPSFAVVPYILYSSAIFVFIAVIASFFFISTPESNYNVISSESISQTDTSADDSGRTHNENNNMDSKKRSSIINNESMTTEIDSISTTSVATDVDYNA